LILDRGLYLEHDIINVPEHFVWVCVFWPSEAQSFLRSRYFFHGAINTPPASVMKPQV